MTGKIKQGVFALLGLMMVAAVAVPAYAANSSLTVGLYPWVPRIEQFQDSIRENWSKVQPDVELVFLTSEEWDGGYHMNPPSNADVYVMDAMFLNYFNSIGSVETLAANEVSNPQDFFSYAIDGVKNPDGTYLAVPMLGCANIIFYHKDDTAIANANTQTELRQTLNTCTYTSMIPPDARGLMIDMQGASTAACRYIESEAGIQNTWPISLPEEIDPTAMGFLKNMMNMASFENATEAGDNTYNRGTWYSEGYGRIFVGYTETFSAMDAATRADTHIKPFPASDNADAPTMFYSDLIAVNPSANGRGNRALAVQLSNVIADSQTIIDSIGPGDGSAYPQYLMPVRPSVFDELSQTFPKYQEMKEMVENSNATLFALDSNSRNWFDAMQDQILAGTRENYPCGCDIQATQSIPDNSQAPAICNQTCADHGGWNGQWTNQYPAAQEGSVCGCNTCPVSTSLDKTPRANDN
ncbi:thiamine pyridinylase [Terasakiella sp. A23]|uniref:thiamine pyridinylase n=1 Tax=Terasakiella sp. FCG-A23 TaxID=3080561 RepID=UPI002952F39D|nr:thiamine pyridinylase [Terasakiella sp. A23]MDV7338409.1 thiamine pyridinylase [Terasakiella sp. A23]